MPKEGNKYIEPFSGRGNMYFLSKKNLKFNEWILNDLCCPFLPVLATMDEIDFPQEMTWELFVECREKRKHNDVSSILIEPAIGHLGHFGSSWKQKYKNTRPWNKSEYTDILLQAKNLLTGATISNVTWSALPWDSFNSEDFVYFDPPYMNTEHRYYSDIDHEEFLERIKTLKCKWLLSNSDNQFYRERLGEPAETKIRKAGSKAFGKISGVITECLWKGNY
jgi:site-specific DNA-adenine methylase